MKEHVALAMYFCILKLIMVIIWKKGSIKRNKISIRKMDIKCSESGKTRRKKIRAVKKGLIIKEKGNEPFESHIAGGF